MADDPQLRASVKSARSSFSGVHALYARNLTTGSIIEMNADLATPTASVIKVAIMAVLYSEVNAGSVDLLDRLTVIEQVGGTGVLKEITPGIQLKLLDLCRLMIVLSDNTATEMIVSYLGKERINAILGSWGLEQTEVRFHPRPRADPRDYAVSTVRETGWLLERIAACDLVSMNASTAMQGHLSRQQDHGQLTRLLPYNQFASYAGDVNELQLMNKTGQDDGIRTDAAIIRFRSTTFVAVSFTSDSPDRTFGLDHEGSLLNAQIGRILFEHWSGK